MIKIDEIVNLSPEEFDKEVEKNKGYKSFWNKILGARIKTPKHIILKYGHLSVFNWNSASLYQELDSEILLKFKNKVVWKHIWNAQKIKFEDISLYEKEGVIDESVIEHILRNDHVLETDKIKIIKKYNLKELSPKVYEISGTTENFIHQCIEYGINIDFKELYSTYANRYSMEFFEKYKHLYKDDDYILYHYLMFNRVDQSFIERNWELFLKDKNAIRNISGNRDLTEEFFIKYENYLDWTYVASGSNKNVPEDLILKHLDLANVGWMYGSYLGKRRYSHDFFIKLKSFIETNKPLKHHKFIDAYIIQRFDIGEEYIRNNYDEFKGLMNNVSRYQKLSYEFILKHFDDFKNHLRNFANNRYMDPEVKKQIKLLIIYNK